MTRCVSDDLGTSSIKSQKGRTETLLRLKSVSAMPADSDSAAGFAAARARRGAHLAAAAGRLRAGGRGLLSIRLTTARAALRAPPSAGSPRAASRTARAHARPPPASPGCSPHTPGGESRPERSGSWGRASAGAADWRGAPIAGAKAEAPATSAHAQMPRILLFRSMVMACREILLAVSSSWEKRSPKEKRSPGTTLVAVGSGRRSGGAGERARAEGAWLRRPPFIAG